MAPVKFLYASFFPSLFWDCLTDRSLSHRVWPSRRRSTPSNISSALLEQAKAFAKSSKLQQGPLSCNALKGLGVARIAWFYKRALFRLRPPSTFDLARHRSCAVLRPAFIIGVIYKSVAALLVLYIILLECPLLGAEIIGHDTVSSQSCVSANVIRVFQ